MNIKKHGLAGLFAATFLTSMALVAHAHIVAKEITLEEAVARNIQALIEDTVNEGEQTAYVIKKNGKYEVDCSISNNKKSKNLKWAYCKVDFLVTYEEMKEARTCGLLYSFQPKNIENTLVRGNEESFADCVEYLAESF